MADKVLIHHPDTKIEIRQDRRCPRDTAFILDTDNMHDSLPEDLIFGV